MTFEMIYVICVCACVFMCVCICARPYVMIVSVCARVCTCVCVCVIYLANIRNTGDSWVPAAANRRALSFGKFSKVNALSIAPIEITEEMTFGNVYLLFSEKHSAFRLCLPDAESAHGPQPETHTHTHTHTQSHRSTEADTQ